MDLTQITRPDAAQILLITPLATMKKHLRINYTAEDDLIERYIRQAYAYFDGRHGWLNRSILTQTWKLTLPGFVSRYATSDTDSNPTYGWKATSSIELPLPPLQSVTHVKYWSDGVLTTLATDQYSVINSGLMGRIVRAHGATWPTAPVVDTREDAIEIQFVAGFGAAADVLLDAAGIEDAIYLLAADRFRNREDTYAEPRLVAVNRKLINGIEKKAGRYRVMNSYA